MQLRSMFWQFSEETASCNQFSRETILEYYNSTLFSLFWSAFISKKYRVNFFFTIEEMKFLSEMIRVCEANQYLKERRVESVVEKIFWAIAVLMYQHVLGAES